eukprot:Blabericola_migrator_1__7202@NODE_3655_length_1598_cov_118_703462_g2265_i0_p1_GENE_NODE_3655_length_1598_cov_118_703462_g2265_i0NODE_3655_length_1598_cov_118_703462_g2265_i0_p1_ORF_typecomplete_len207_score36_16_NODE_3655_length_1598_cov_118_703462_g2265_i081701
MSARAANVFMQQAYQRQRVTKHDTKASLLFTGVVMAMTNDYTDASGISFQSLQRDGIDDKDFSESAKRCANILREKGFLKLQPQTGKLTVAFTERTIRDIQDINVLVLLNKFLNVLISQDMKRVNPDPEEWYNVALAQYSDACEEYTKRSSTERKAVKRFRDLVAIKLLHAESLRKAQWNHSVAFRIWMMYMHMAPRELIAVVMAD